MFFTLSKVLAWAVAPANILVLLLVLGGVLWLVGRRRTGGALIAGVTGAFLLIAVLPVGGWVWHSLESRFPKLTPTDLPAAVTGIIVLGGAVKPKLWNQHNQVSVNGRAERIIEGARLARRYPDAVVLYSGGSGHLGEPQWREAPLAAQLLEELGVSTDQLLLEENSRSTHENAVLSKQLAAPKPGDVWVLVTTAGHMPRAMSVFRSLEWDVLPYPVDYAGPPEWAFRAGFDLAGGLTALNRGVREYVGLFIYWVSGRAAAPFPVD